MIPKTIVFFTNTLSLIGTAAALIMMLALMLTEIFARLLFSKSTLMAQEFSAYLLVFFVFISLAYVFKEEKHIRITLVSSRLSPRIRKILDIFMHVVALFVTIYMLYWSGLDAHDCFILNEKSETIYRIPMFIPKSFIPIGLFVFMLQILVSMVTKIKEVIR
ncbi:MAG: TRAP transporter small permease [Desulfotignum sp.]|nr:TRAP transporter small permease [Desulfotignum sp.]